jgi:hypothetical protein
MFTALILVCSLSVTPELRDCNRDNASQVMQVPEQFATPMMCGMQGQAFLGGTTIGRNMTEDERVKLLCIRSPALSKNVG